MFKAILEPGRYEVRLSYPANKNRASNVQVKVHHQSGVETCIVNQRLSPEIDGVFHSLGKFSFEGEAMVRITSEEADGYVIADAIQFLPAP